MNSLLQESLLGTKNIHEAIVLKREDGHIKGRTSTNLTVARETHEVIAEFFANPRETREKGMRLLGNFYNCIRCDQSSIYGKSIDEEGIIIARTQEYLVIGFYQPTMQPGVAVEAVERLADYFRKKGR